MARLKSLYNEELKQQIKEELGLANVMQVPKITKITLFYFDIPFDKTSNSPHFISNIIVKNTPLKHSNRQ